VPFTPAHAAAVLPLRRTRLVLSAMLIGSFAPDFEYFLNMAPHGQFGHTLAGMFLFSLPVALVVLWLFHRWMKPLVAYMAPRALRARLAPYLAPFPFAPRRRFLLIALSALAGIATHIAWDSFTHPGMPLVQHWAALRALHRVPLLGVHQTCRILQLISTFAGLAVLCGWAARWYDRAEVVALPPEPRWELRRVALWLGLPLGAAVCAALRVWVRNGGHWGHFGYSLMVFVVSWIAFLWWWMVVAGYFADSAGELNRRSQGVNAALTVAPDTDE
jgi:hypothetical protein